MNNATFTLLAAVLMGGFAHHTAAQTRTPPPDLAAASIEDLMKVLITTASRVPEGLAAAPARVQVVTAAQIERRGYRFVAEDVSESPGLSVASSVGQYGLYNQTASYGVRLGAKASLMLSGQFLYADNPISAASTRKPLAASRLSTRECSTRFAGR
jgi:outer membrane receptor protein involved in Fe transport